MTYRDRPLWIVLGVTLAVMVLVFIEPLSYDNAIYQTIARDLLERGRIPYISSFDQNFPGIIFIHSFAIWVFGPSSLGFRMLDVVIQLVFVVVLYWLWSRFLFPRTAALAAILYILYYVAVGPSMYGQRDLYASMALLSCMYLILLASTHDTHSNLLLGGAGMLLGIAIIIKPTFLFYAVLIGSYLWLSNMSPQSLFRAAFFLTFSMLPLTAILLFYATISGGLEAFYNSTIRFNLDLYSSLGTTTSFWKEIARSALTIPFAIAGILLSRTAKLSYFTTTLTRQQRLFFSVALFGSIALVIVQGKNFPYHFAPFFVLLTPLTALGIERTFAFLSGRAIHRYAVAASCFLCSFIAYNPITPVTFIKAIAKSKDPFEAVRQAKHNHALSGAAPEDAVIHYLSKPENRAGTIEICSFDPRPRLDINRICVGPYVLMDAIALRTDGTNAGPPHYTHYQRDWQTEYLDTLHSTFPRFLILARNMHFWYIRDIYNDCLHYLPGFDSLLTTSYHYDSSFGGFQIYRRW